MLFSFLYFFGCESVDVEFLFPFRVTSAKTLKMQYFLHINTKLSDALSMVTIKNFQ